MPRKGSRQPYRPPKEYHYNVGDIAELAGMTRNALGVAKIHGKIDPKDFKSVVSFLIRRIIDCRFSGDLFDPIARTVKRRESGKGGVRRTRTGTKKTTRRR
jgi:hypothetical protein